MQRDYLDYYFRFNWFQKVFWAATSCCVSVSHVVFSRSLKYSSTLYRNLNGSGGRSGWRWLLVGTFIHDIPGILQLYRFIIDGVITLPIALYGFLIFPDTPATTKAFYLSDHVRKYYLILGRVFISCRKNCCPQNA